MVKIRINELARDIEVKAKAVIDYLAEIGIEDKKSHSSSIEGELVEQVKKHFRDEKERAARPAPPPPVQAPAAVETLQQTKAPAAAEAPKVAVPKETPAAIPAAAA